MMENNHYNFIHNKSQIKQFYNLFYKDTFTSPDLVYMILLASRRKYESETKTTDSMFARKVVKNDDYSKFLKMIKEYNHEKHPDLPEKCLVLYATLNPRSTFKALTEFNNKMNQWTHNTIVKGEMGDSIKNIDSIIKTCIQNNSFEKRYIQLDLDIKQEIYTKIIEEFLLEHSIKIHCVIETRGGYHYIINTGLLTNEQKKVIFNGKLKKLTFDTVDRNGKSITKM